MPLGLRPVRGMWWQADRAEGLEGREGCAWEPEVVRRLQRDRAHRPRRGGDGRQDSGAGGRRQGGQRR